jgi:hypothetical protein
MSEPSDTSGVIKDEPKAIEQALLALRTGGKAPLPALKLESECAGRTFRDGGGSVAWHATLRETSIQGHTHLSQKPG